MNLLTLKKEFEQYFFDNYTETSVHWAGDSFDTNEYDEWVFFEYLGSSIDDCGLDNSTAVHNGSIYICCIAETRIRAIELADICINLFKGKKIAECFIKQITIDGQGTLETKNKSYIDVVMQVSMV